MATLDVSFHSRWLHCTWHHAWGSQNAAAILPLEQHLVSSLPEMRTLDTVYVFCADMYTVSSLPNFMLAPTAIDCAAELHPCTTDVQHMSC